MRILDKLGALGEIMNQTWILENPDEVVTPVCSIVRGEEIAIICTNGYTIELECSSSIK